jgi:hypothetical protein
MKPQNLINDKQDYQQTATHFFNIMFAKALRMNYIGRSCDPMDEALD